MQQGAMEGGAANVQGWTVCSKVPWMARSECPGMDCMQQGVMEGGAANVRGLQCGAFITL